MPDVNSGSSVTEASQEDEGKKYALVVGVNKAAKVRSLSALQYAESDAIGVSWFLSRKECNFAFPNGLLIGEAASAQNVRKAIISLIDNKSKKDLLLFFFIGHGYSLEIAERSFEVYLVTSDFSPNPYEAMANPSDYLSLDDIRKLLYEYQKEANVICILDCCDAGYIVESPRSNMQIAQSLEAFAENTQRAEPSSASSHRTWAILASTEKGAYAYEGIYENGEGHALMTGLIIDSLSGYDRSALDRNGNLTLQMLHVYLQTHMRTLEPRSQHAVLRGTFNDPWILAHYPLENPVSRNSEGYPQPSLRKTKIIHQSKPLTDQPVQVGQLKSGESLKQPFDMDISPATFADLDLEQVGKFLKQMQAKIQRNYWADLSEHAQMQALGLLHGEHPIYGALLYFGHDPSRQIKGAYTRCIYWNNTGRLDSQLDDKEYRGSLFQQFTQAGNFLRSHLAYGSKHDGTSERPEIPFRVLEEALANALVHREYATEPSRVVRTEGVQVEIFSDRVQIKSPGGPPVLPLDQDSHPRNSQIMWFFYLAGLVEGIGTGIPRMRNKMQEAGLPEPHIRPSEQTFTITLSRIPQSPVSPTQADVDTPAPESLPSSDGQTGSDTAARDVNEDTLRIPRIGRSPRTHYPHGNSGSSSRPMNPVFHDNTAPFDESYRGTTQTLPQRTSQMQAPAPLQPTHNQQMSPQIQNVVDTPASQIVGRTPQMQVPPPLSPKEGQKVLDDFDAPISQPPPDQSNLGTNNKRLGPPVPIASLRFRKQLLVTLCILLCTLLIVGMVLGIMVFVVHPASNAQEPVSMTIKIASDFPTNGQHTTDGLPLQNGVQMAITEANNVHFLPGYTLQLVAHNDAGTANRPDPQVGANNLKQAIADNLVVGVIGPGNSSVALKELPLANQAPLALLSPSTTFPCLTESAADDPNCTGTNDIVTQMRPTSQLTFFRLATTDARQGKAAADYFFQIKHYSKVLLLKDDTDAYSFGLAQAFQTEWQRIGGPVIPVDFPQSATSVQDYQNTLQTAASFQPNLIYFAGNDPNGSYVLQALSNIPTLKTVAFAGGDGLMESNFSRTVASLHRDAPVYVSLPVKDPVHSGTATGADFETNYRANGYNSYRPYAAAAYDCTKMLIQAIKTALQKGTSTPHGTQDHAGGAQFRQAVLQALRQHFSYTGATGTHSFDRNGDTTNYAISFYQANLSAPPTSWTWLQQVNG